MIIRIIHQQTNNNEVKYFNNYNICTSVLLLQIKHSSQNANVSKNTSALIFMIIHVADKQAEFETPGLKEY
jgi:hypothetical protein